MHILIVTAEPICDFCNSEEVVARYHANDFVVEGPLSQHITQESIGDWAACPVCSKLVDAGDWNELLKHAVASFYAANPEVFGQIPVGVVFTNLMQTYSQLRDSDFHKVELGG
jgi:hypothetical protein